MALKLFNNILAYRLTDPAAFHKHGSEGLEDSLAEKPARLPAPMELSAAGFTPPLGIEDELVEVIRPYTYVIAVNFAERMVPGKIVRQRVSTKVREIEEEQDRKVYAREKQQIKDDVLSKMLPHAFIDQKIVRVMISGPYIFIDSTSANKGEDVLSMLREVLGTLGVRPVAVKTTPIESFTQWFTRNQLPENLSLTGDFKANNSGDESDFINGKGTSPEFEGLSDLVLEHGRRVTVLGLRWFHQEFGVETAFTVNEMLGIKGIKWPDEIVDMASADAGEEAEQITLLRATYLLLAAEINALLADLLAGLGGEELPEGQESLEQKFAAALKGVTHINGIPVDEIKRRHGQPDTGDSDLDDLIRRTHERADELLDDAAETLYASAVRWARESGGRTTISAIQRQFRLGYNRAAQMIEQMEADGVVSPMNRNGGRDVLKTDAKITLAANNLAIDEDDLI